MFHVQCSMCNVPKPRQSESFPGASAASGSSTSHIAHRTSNIGFRGFTLVELLVVVSIIALLLAILLPAMNKAKQMAVAIKCQANLHQIGLAHSAYQSENNGCMASGWSASGIEKLFPYLGLKPPYPWANLNPIYNCPLWPHGQNHWDAWPSYGINGYLGGPPGGNSSEDQIEVINKPYRISNVLYPSGKLYAADVRKNDRIFWNSMYWSVAHTEGSIDLRHPGTTFNVAFLDGHVQPVGQPPILEYFDYNQFEAWLKINVPPPPGL